jgi:hypothetical protein
MAAAGSSTSQPTTSPTADDSTPVGFLHASGENLPAGGFPAAIALFTARDEKERKVAEVLANYSLAVARTESTVRQKWGPAADDDFVHALGEKTDADIDQAEVEIHDDHAVVIFKGDDSSPMVLIRLDGHWKVDTGEAIKQTEKQGSVEAWTKYSNDVIGLLKRVDRDLAADKYTSSADLCKEAAAAVSRILNSSPM